MTMRLLQSPPTVQFDVQLAIKYNAKYLGLAKRGTNRDNTEQSIVGYRNLSYS